MTKLSVALLACCLPRIASAQSASGLGSLLDSVVPAAMAAERIPGAVVTVVRGGRVIFSKGYGFADVEARRPMTDSTIVRIGSISKVMTAVAVAQLIDRGRVHLDSNVNRYLRDLRIRSRYRTPTTVRHLLTHTAALDEIRPGPLADGEASLQPLREYLRPRLIQYAPPGWATAYSTYGIALAGVIIEDVSGLPFEQYLVDSIWRPLGMTRTWVTVPQAERPHAATPYDVAGDSVVRAPWEWYHTTPASSMNSTARDMARFMIAQLAGRSAIMSDRMTREMQREHVTMHPMLPGYGLGWQQIRRANADRGVQHGGDIAGFSSLMTLLPGRNLGVFVAGHREGSDLRHTVTRAVLDRVAPAPDPAKRPVSMHASREIAAQAVARYAGHYRANIVCHTCTNPRRMTEIDVVANQDGSLSAFSGRFIEVSPRFFRSEDGSRRFGFHEDSLGRITHLTVGSWQVLERVPMTGASVDSAAIRAAVLDYVDGWYTGDAARMERAVHPDLAKRIWRPDPERGANRMENQTAMTLVQGTRRGWGRETAEPMRRREIEILEIFGNAASARARMSDWIDLMHLARVNGEWKIVNVLWELSHAERGERAAAATQPVVRTPPQNPGLRAEIQAVNDSMVAAFNSGDMLAVARFYTDDARIDGERGELVQGRAAVDKYWTGIRNAKSWKLDVIDVGGHSDNPYQIGRSTLVTTGPNGDRTSVVEFLVVWRREPAGGLRIAVDYYRY
jgi:CubicO group peptidase (beta-lactamase class C family)/ketosteroid isomerase-like protein